MRLSSIIDAASTTTAVCSATSRCFTCASSCAITPSSSAGGHARGSPELSASAEYVGPRPVASASGSPSGMR